MSKKYHLAQLNIARMKGVNINDPIMAEFVAKIAEINALGEQSKGFVWRLKDEENDNATAFNPFDDEQIIVNMSVWESIEDLENYTFRSAHADVMRRRKDWFVKFGKSSTVLWYIEANQFPTLEEAAELLTHLQEKGASAYAFDFKHRFEKPVE